MKLKKAVSRNAKMWVYPGQIRLCDFLRKSQSSRELHRRCKGCNPNHLGGLLRHPPKWALGIGQNSVFLSQNYLTFNYKTNSILSMEKNTTENKDKILQVKMDSETIEKAKDKAKKQGLNLSLVVRKLLEDFVNDPQPKLIF